MPNIGPKAQKWLKIFHVLWKKSGSEGRKASAA